MIKPLTSLRFFFALSVFFSHLSFLKNSKVFERIYTQIFYEGFLGVGFFFILSGFILTLNYKERFKRNEISLKSFFIARFARIYPLHFLTLLFALPIVIFDLKIFFSNLFLLQSFSSNVKYYFSFNAPSWSISNEMFFYMGFPILMFFTNKINFISKIAFVFIIISIIMLLNFQLHESAKHYWLYISPLTRIFDFILGIFLYEMYSYLKNKNFKVSNFIQNILEFLPFLILVVFFIFKNNFDLNYRFSIYYWFPMCLIIGVAAKPFHNANITIMSKILSNKLLVYLGEISFAFYLIHLLVINYFEKYQLISTFKLSYSLSVLLMLTITICLSIFVHEIIEKPFNRKIKLLFK